MNSFNNYSDLLKEDQWKQKCNEILSRDHFTCQSCGKIGYHNGSPLAFDSVDQCFDLIDNWNWLIDGVPLSKYFGCLMKEVNKAPAYNDIDLYLIGNYNGFQQYEIVNPIDRIFDFPLGLFFMSEETKETIFFHLLENNISILDDRNNKRDSSINVIKFDKILSSNAFLTLERKRGAMHLVDSINISFHDILINFESPYKYGLNGLNIHHKKYIKGRKPWEYEADSLVTLCEDCHHDIHEKVITPILDESGNRLGVAMICDKCGGSGYLPQYKHVEHGICFKCKGEGVILDY